MYNMVGAPVAMGVGAGAVLPFAGMSPLWAVLAAFAIIACLSAINRIIPRLIVGGQDWKPGQGAAGAGVEGPASWKA